LTLPDLHTLWIGPHLTWLERLSLRSWLEHGHRVILWRYEPIEGVPAGVQLADAKAILPKGSITRHRQTGSVAFFSNRFRYHLLRQQPATWLDADIVLLRPLDSARPHLFGWETPTSICNAVMRLPPESPVLKDLIRFTEAAVPVPGWWALKYRLRQRIRGLIGCQHRGEDMNWGSFGPRALTYFLERRNLADRALPIETFYPIHWDDFLLFFASPDAISARLTDKSIGVHLWSSSYIRERRYEPAPANSWLAVMCDRYAISAIS
jgi:Alpha 1,4-glycosyltransferase conserved region